MTPSAIGSPMVKYRGPFVLGQPDEAMVQRQHDAEGHDVRTRSGPAPRRAAPDDRGHQRIVAAARALGLEKRDFAALFDALAQMAGVESVRD